MKRCTELLFDETTSTVCENSPNKPQYINTVSTQMVIPAPAGGSYSTPGQYGEIFVKTYIVHIRSI